MLATVFTATDNINKIKYLDEVSETCSQHYPRFMWTSGQDQNVDIQICRHRDTPIEKPIIADGFGVSHAALYYALLLMPMRAGLDLPDLPDLIDVTKCAFGCLTTGA